MKFLSNPCTKMGQRPWAIGLTKDPISSPTFKYLLPETLLERLAMYIRIKRERILRACTIALFTIGLHFCRHWGQSLANSSLALIT